MLQITGRGTAEECIASFQQDTQRELAISQKKASS
jgi:hypothetical protein